MNENVATLFSAFLYVLMFAIIIRSLMSWFPGSQNNAFARLLHRVTEPLLQPVVRSIMPRTGMIDLSAMVVILVLYVMVQVVQSAADA